jgi:hypothetical protein
MCLYVKTKKVIFKTSNKNIICFKNGKKVNGNLKPKYQYRFRYKKNKLTERVDIEFYFKNRYDKYITYQINEGYHSNKHFFSKTYYDSTNHVFIIPKNTKYVEGLANDKEDEKGYVSETLIWIGHKWSPITWLKILFKY